MNTARKAKEAYLAKNLKYLRTQKNRTLEEMAGLLYLNSKSSFKAYEENRALPDIHKIMKLATFFNVAVADLIYKDLENFVNKANKANRKLYEIWKVPISAAAGYARSFGDNNYLRKLKTIAIPYEPYGIARAFDIVGDSMEPEINNGSTVVGIKIEANEVKDKKSYVIITKDAIQCKCVRFDEKSDFMYLISANSKYLPMHIRKEDVLEMWEIWKKI